MVNPNGRPARKRLGRGGAKEKIVDMLTRGASIDSACAEVEYSRKSYELWRRDDPGFRNRCDIARQLSKADRGPDVERGERLGFAEWREKYLKSRTFWHQLQWIDLLEGHEPRDLHPAQTYYKGKRNRIVVNVPPFHAKSMTLTVDYCVYRLCMDPSFRILIVSAGSLLATDFLYGIKQRLTSSDFIDLQRAYAPEGGWETTAESWTDSRIIFGTDVRTSGFKKTHEKDPNVQTVGMRSKIYGKRADLIILDDAVDGTNVAEYAKQMTWLRREVSSRLEAQGKLIVIGTRIASVDLYSELMKPENYANGKVPWTHFASPAILEEGKTPDEHVTLWPYTDQPWVQSFEDADECTCEDPKCADGLIVNGQRVYARWDGKHLEMGPRAENNATEWALVYQQKSVPENATFPEHAVTKTINGSRYPGPLKEQKVGHPITGMQEMYLIGSCDPSIKGFAGLIVYAVHRESQKRYILDVRNMRAPTTAELEGMLKTLTDQYGIDEWRVENTGLLQFFTQSAALRSWFQSRGVRFTEHHTGKSKWDAAYGVSSMASLFGEYDKSWDNPGGDWREITPPLIELPNRTQDGIRALVHQLIIWTPDLDPAKIPCDLVMALWFAEIGAREFLGVGRNGNVVQFGRSNKFVSPRRRQNAVSVNLADFRTGI